jgi:hypothetical protein
MDVVLWVLQAVLAVVMLSAGAMKLIKSKEALLEDPRMAWVEDFSGSTLRIIGGLEIAAAVGLILPWWLDIAPVLTPIAALGVVALMTGAMITHRRRGETQALLLNAAIALTAVVIAIGRFVAL